MPSDLYTTLVCWSSINSTRHGSSLHMQARGWSIQASPQLITCCRSADYHPTTTDTDCNIWVHPERHKTSAFALILWRGFVSTLGIVQQKTLRFWPGRISLWSAQRTRFSSPLSWQRPNVPCFKLIPWPTNQDSIAFKLRTYFSFSYDLRFNIRAPSTSCVVQKTVASLTRY